MKKALLNFANKMLSKDELKSVKGGLLYCFKDGNFWGYYNSPQDAEAAIIADSGSGTYNCVENIQ